MLLFALFVCPPNRLLLKRILNIGVVDKGGIGERVQERNDIGSLDGSQSRVMPLHRKTNLLHERIFVDDEEAVVVVLRHHFFERIKTAVVHVRSGQGDVAERRCSKLAVV